MKGMTLEEIRQQPVWKILSQNLTKLSSSLKESQLKGLKEHYFLEVGNFILSEESKRMQDEFILLCLREIKRGKEKKKDAD